MIVIFSLFNIKFKDGANYVHDVRNPLCGDDKYGGLDDGHNLYDGDYSIQLLMNH